MNQFIQFVSNHWPLFIALAIVLVLIFINEISTIKKRAKSLSPADTVDLINNQQAAIIDIRDKENFRNGHIVNAINCSENDFDNNKMDKYKTETLVIVCNKGLQSSTLASKLKTQGFSNVMVLDGGIDAWKSENLPLVKNK